MRDGWFDHDSLSFATKTHPSFTNFFVIIYLYLLIFPYLLVPATSCTIGISP